MAEKHAPRRIRIEIESAIDASGRPDVWATSIRVDDELLTNVVSIDMLLNANKPHEGLIDIRRSEGAVIIAGEARPIPALLCAECYTEVHFGKRETANPAVTIAGSNAACAEHLYFSSPALPDRTEGGIIIPGANGSL